jgi:hypothetical protein
MLFAGVAGPAWMPAYVDSLGFAKQNPQLKNGMDAIFEQRKGLKRKYRKPRRG